MQLDGWKYSIWGSTWCPLGQVRPQIDKTAAIVTCPCPKTKKEVRQFLGLAGYYRHFIGVISPLPDLNQNGALDPVQWMEQCLRAFTQMKAALCGGPLLHSPDFSLPFDRGLGAVLSQVVEGEERPLLYISQKLSMFLSTLSWVVGVGGKWGVV